MQQTSLKANLLLLLTAFIWGTAFVAQRMGMEHMGPMAFNGARFLLGALVLLPFLINKKTFEAIPKLLAPGLIAGSVVFLGSALQQYGLVYTTAGKAGFITGLYVVLVPMLGAFIKIPARLSAWIGALVATLGMYLLSVTEAMTIDFGDFLVLIGALFWAIHILIISKISQRVPPMAFACCQFIVCSLFSFIAAFFTEDMALVHFNDAAESIAYGGILSVGIAYTLQVIAQKEADPTHAAIIMCLEAVFAAGAGWLILHETLSGRGLMGCILMLVGMLIAQMPGKLRRAKAHPA